VFVHFINFACRGFEGLAQYRVLAEFNPYYVSIVYRILVWKSKGKRPLGIPRRRYDVTLKLDHRKDERVWTSAE
jgi:hypothetical protein